MIKNFKSIGSVPIALDLKPLTILTGPNASGKSTILEAIAVMAQSTRFTSLPKSLERSVTDGELIRFPNLEAISHKGRSSTFEIEVGMSLTKAEQRAISTKASLLNYLYRYTPKDEHVWHKFSLGEKRQKIMEITRYKASDKTYRTLISTPNIRRIIGRTLPMADYNTKDILADEVFRPKGEGSIFFSKEDTAKSKEDYVRMLNSELERCTKYVEIIKEKLRRVFFISTLRGRIEFNVPVAQEVPSWIGPNGERLVELLSAIFSQRKYASIADNIVNWSNKFGIASLKAGWRGKNTLGSDFEDSVLRSSLDLPLASYGSRQVLTVVTQIFWSQPNDVIMIEEPEISLHPQSQVILQELFAEGVAQKKQIIITTHSPLMLLALSKVIGSGNISRDDVAVYEIKKHEYGSSAHALKIDKRGYIENWVPSFKTVEDELFGKWAESFD